MNADTWAVVVATVVGPIIAVIITLWYERTSREKGREYERKMWILRTLMATRKSQISQEHVMALNQIEIEFYNVGTVQTAWRRYLAHLSKHKNDIFDEELEQWDDERVDILAHLIWTISSHMGFGFPEIDIKSGGYAPRGWKYRDDRLGIIQELTCEMLSGARPLRVEAAVPPQPSAAETGAVAARREEVVSN